MRNVALCALCFAWLTAAGLAAAADAGAQACAPVPVAIAPLAGTDLTLYEGRSRQWRIVFGSERPGQRVDVFPEPPVRIVHRLSGSLCTIQEGGVWSSSGVYIGARGSRVLLLETSGGSSVITVYEPRHCARLAEIDVSDARWRFTAAGIETGQDCTGPTIDQCRTRRTVRLGADCSVVPE